MTRQSISLTAPNEEWLKNQVETEEFSSKSEAINYLTKKARSQEEYYNSVSAKIDKGEKSGFVKKTKQRRNVSRIQKRAA